MIYSDFNGLKLSQLGMGTMRLPLNEDKSIDEAETERIFDFLIKNGLNYFDTANPYHGGMSEIVTGKILKKYPRDSFYLATKFPGHQIRSTYYPDEVFEEQLKKCQVDYFDFYLLHNVYENSIDIYMSEKWNILNYFLEQKRNGRIKYLGFSFHGRVDTLKKFLDYCGDEMDFCQIQLNYLDWTFQDGKEKYNILTKHNIPVWVMEPLRGGRLAHLDRFDEKMAWEMRPGESVAACAFRFLQCLPNVKVILSGMSTFEQAEDNIKTFAEKKKFSLKESERLLSMANGMKKAIPCTACRYCCDGCPAGLDIPLLIKIYNDVRFDPTITASMQLDTIPEDKKSTACIGCGKCAEVCPQKINIPEIMKECSEAMKTLPNWTEICRQREMDRQKVKNGI
ncbi:MAG: aldo/keto reductase [Ruminococcus sp.]|nr:aldo/keto reductase [Candidatus Copronaster equi]